MPARQNLSTDHPRAGQRLRGRKSEDDQVSGNLVPPSHRVPSFLAMRFNQLCLGIMSEVVGAEGLNTKSYGALTTLDAEPGIDQQQLAARLGIDKVSAGQLVDRLERDGLISRRLDPTDRRARVLHLSPKGLALRRRLQPAALSAQDRILSALLPKERSTLIDLLTRVVSSQSIYARPGNGRSRPRRRSLEAPSQ